MSKFFDTLFLFIASSIVLLVRNSLQAQTPLTFTELYVMPIALGLIVYVILQLISYFIKSYNRPLKKYEGYWIETIAKPAKTAYPNYISILELKYTNNAYNIRGVTFLSDGTKIATWRADRTHPHDNDNKLLDYIYTSDVQDESFGQDTVRGYATIDFKTSEGYILDIMSEDNKKQYFKLTNKITKEKDFENVKVSKKLKEELIKFFKS